MGLFTSFSGVRRATVAAGVIVCGTLAAVPTAAHASGPHSVVAKKTTINTYKAWDGATSVFEFGRPATSTYGQVITVPDKRKHLTKFTFAWQNMSMGTMVVRGEVYAWDGTKATGSALFESSPKTVTFGDGAFHNVSFTGSAAKVTPGSQYVVFASIDKDFEACTPNYLFRWGAVDDGVYGGGSFVYQSNVGDESRWTAAAWTIFPFDLATKIYLTT